MAGNSETVTIKKSLLQELVDKIDLLEAALDRVEGETTKARVPDVFGAAIRKGNGPVRGPTKKGGITVRGNDPQGRPVELDFAAANKARRSEES